MVPPGPPAPVSKPVATLLLGGGVHALGEQFFEPTVLGDIRKGMLLLDEEIFGPVAPLALEATGRRKSK